jgi:uncharacterized membrane protein
MPPSGPAARRSPFRILWRVLRAHYRLVICGAVGAAVGFGLPTSLGEPAAMLGWLPRDFSPVTRGLIGWNIAILLYLAAATHIVLRATQESIRRRAMMSDEGRTTVLFLTATATCVAIGAIIAELGQTKNLYEDERIAHIGLAVATVFSSWTFMHLIFAFHYAHEFYSDADEAPEEAASARGGLHFPKTPAPQYVDFLYFSYVVGVACQTADVEICSGSMRKVALVHGVVAFFFNTTILALMVNISSQFV